MASSARESDDRALLLQVVDEAFDEATFNETNLRSSIGRIPPAVRGWRPPDGRRSIAEIVLHCAYWKYAVRRRLRGDPRGSFPLKGSNWFEVEEPVTPERWKECLSTLDDEHHRLREAIGGSNQTLLDSSESGQALVRRIFGVAMHDAYHTGQINLIKAMFKRGGQAGSPSGGTPRDGRRLR